MTIPSEFVITTAKQSQKIDAQTIDEFGIDGFTLMEIAGSAAAKHLLTDLTPGTNGVVLCGKGNNGGDALVTARYLAQHQFQLTVVFISGTDDLSPNAEKNYQLLQKVASNGQAPLQFCKSWHEFHQSLAPDFIIDGMLGTGLDSDLRGDYTDAVKWVNESSAKTYAMDMPTGLHADTGEKMGSAVKADQTYAFGVRKQGYYLNDGPAQVGNINFCELPFPDHLINKNSTYLISECWVQGPESKPARHKYEAGVVYIIAGSEGLTGAAMMAAKSAWSEGVGAVILLCPRGVLPVFENNLPQIIKKPVGDKNDVFFKENHLQEVRNIIDEKNGPVLLGPGLGRNKSTVTFSNKFLSRVEREIIIDADSLWALSQQENWQKPSGASWIITPHPGELSQLLGKKINSDNERLKEVRNLSEQKDITTLSKGFPVIIGTPKGDAYLTDYDTRIFSRAGFGDILAGKISAYKALGSIPVQSCIYALLNGKLKAQAAIKREMHHLEPLDLV